jgi:hypothetical protein
VGYSGRSKQQIHEYGILCWKCLLAQQGMSAEPGPGISLDFRTIFDRQINRIQEATWAAYTRQAKVKELKLDLGSERHLAGQLAQVSKCGCANQKPQLVILEVKMNDEKKRQEEQPEDPNRRTFLQGTAVTLGGAALAGGLLSTLAHAADPTSGKSGGPGHQSGGAGPIQKKLTKWNTTSHPEGDESHGEIEFTDSKGNTDTTRFFGKWIRGEDSYTVIHRFTATKFTVGHIAIVSGKKGATDGDRRIDRIAVTLVGEDGSVNHLPEQEVRVRIVNPYEGMSTLDAAQAFQRDKAAGKFNK